MGNSYNQLGRTQALRLHGTVFVPDRNTFEAQLFNGGQGGAPMEYYSEYEEDYIKTPLCNTEQVMLTKEKAMKYDVVIEKVPFIETHNDAGGYTVSIGETP